MPGHTTLVNITAVVMGAVAFVAVAVSLGASFQELLTRGEPTDRAPTPATHDDEQTDVMELL